jgi:hypothetical protein
MGCISSHPTIAPESAVRCLRDPRGSNRALNERLSDQPDPIRYRADPPIILTRTSQARRPGAALAD